MILTCPSCSTRYFADDASIGANGRSVRCAACSHTWFVEGRLDLTPADMSPGRTREQVEQMRKAAAAASAQQSPVASTARLRSMQAERERRERSQAAMLAWGATGVAMIGLGAGAIGFREDVVKIWPKSAGVYANLGMSVNLFGLDIDELTVAPEYEGDERVYVVRGAVTNVGGEDRVAPLLRFGLRDESLTEIHAQLANLQGQVIPAGGRLTFEFRLDGPVDRAVDVEATLESPGVDTAVSPSPLETSSLGPLILSNADVLDGDIDGLAGRIDAAAGSQDRQS